MKKSAAIYLAAFSALALLFLTTALGISSTHKEIGHYFQMPDYMGSVPEHVRRAILDRVPAGSSRQTVNRFLAERNIGSDPNSVCANKDQLLVCTIGIRPSFWKLVRETYKISFDFDSNDQLRSVRVQSAYFGAWETKKFTAAVKEPRNSQPIQSASALP